MSCHRLRRSVLGEKETRCVFRSPSSHLCSASRWPAALKARRDHKGLPDHPVQRVQRAQALEPVRQAPLVHLVHLVYLVLTVQAAASAQRARRVRPGQQALLARQACTHCSSPRAIPSANSSVAPARSLSPSPVLVARSKSRQLPSLIRRRASAGRDRHWRFVCVNECRLGRRPLCLLLHGFDVSRVLRDLLDHKAGAVVKE